MEITIRSARKRGFWRWQKKKLLSWAVPSRWGKKQKKSRRMCALMAVKWKYFLHGEKRQGLKANQGKNKYKKIYDEGVRRKIMERQEVEMVVDTDRGYSEISRRMRDVERALPQKSQASNSGEKSNDITSGKNRKFVAHEMQG